MEGDTMKMNEGKRAKEAICLLEADVDTGYCPA